MASMLDSLMKQFTPNIVGQIGKMVGMDSETVTKGLNMASPLVLGAAAKASSTADGAEALARGITKDYGGSMLDNLGGALSSFKPGSSDNLLNSLFGKNLSGITSGLQSKTGINIGALLPVVAPIVMSFLGKMMSTNKMDAAGLSNALQGEMKSLQGSAPDVMGMVNSALGGGLVDKLKSMVGM